LLQQPGILVRLPIHDELTLSLAERVSRLLIKVEKLHRTSWSSTGESKQKQVNDEHNGIVILSGSRDQVCLWD